MPTNTFHYIWMGRVPGGLYEDAFKNGPNNFARQLKEYAQQHHLSIPEDQQIIMWVPEALIAPIKKAGYLDPLITLQPVESLYENAKHLTQDERENLKKTVDLLGEHRAYAAQKDIVQAAVLEEYGGWYFDTTTSIDSLDPLIENQPGDIWFPRATEEPAHIYDEIEVVSPDVWAMYSPKAGEDFYKTMVNGYIQRSKFFFPEKFEHVPSDDAQFSLIQNTDECFLSEGFLYDARCYNGAQGKGEKLITSIRREDFIGYLIVYSLLEALQQTKGSLTNERIKELSSLAKSVVRNTPKIESENIKITKYFKGTWRNQSIRDSENLLVQAVNAGNLVSAKALLEEKGIDNPFSVLGNRAREYVLKNIESILDLKLMLHIFTYSGGSEEEKTLCWNMLKNKVTELSIDELKQLLELKCFDDSDNQFIWGLCRDKLAQLNCDDFTTLLSDNFFNDNQRAAIWDLNKDKLNELVIQPNDFGTLYVCESLSDDQRVYLVISIKNKIREWCKTPAIKEELLAWDKLTQKDHDFIKTLTAPQSNAAAFFQPAAQPADTKETKTKTKMEPHP